MSKGGGQSQTSTNAPWKPAQQYLTDIMGQGQSLAGQAPRYYGGPLTVGATDAEGAAWGARNAYNSSVFGGAAAPQFSDLNSTVTGAMRGNTQLGNMAEQVSPYATNNLMSGFGQTNTSGIAGIQAPGQTNAAGQIGQYGFGTSLDAQGRAPTFGVAGDLDARGAYQNMLSGQPDYAGTQGAIDAANAPILRQFNEQIMPGLNQKATFSNNMTGGIKALNRVLPEMGQRMGENAQNIMNQERLRALDAQERAAGAVTQGGFQGYGLGLQTAQGERGLEQNLAGLNLSADQARGGMMLNDYGTGLSSAQLGLQREGMLSDSQDRYRADLLNLGALGGQFAGQAGSQQLQAAGMFPGVYDMGRQQGTDALEYANYDRALREDALGADQTRFNYMRDQPYDQLGWYSNLINGTASPYGQTTGPAGSKTAGAIGGALAGAQLANGMGYGGWGQLIGAGLGGLGGYYG
jgi:hypothetical protein